MLTTYILWPQQTVTEHLLYFRRSERSLPGGEASRAASGPCPAGRPATGSEGGENPAHSLFDLVSDWTGTFSHAFRLLGSGGEGGAKLRVRRLRTKMPSGRAGGGDVRSGGGVAGGLL